MNGLSWRFDATVGLPSANQYTILYDSTEIFGAAAYAPTAALKAPGGHRGRMQGLRVTGTFKPVTNGATLRFYLLTGDTGTSADWELDTTVSGTSGTGQIAVAAGTTQPFTWAPTAADVMVAVLAGSPAPSDIDAWLQLVTAARAV